MSDANNPLETVFNAVRALPVGDRQAYLDLACRGNPRLREQVERLLEAGPAAEDLFGAKPVGLTDVGVTLEDSSVREGPGTVVGRYKLLQQIGEGGMGIVYMAEQEEPVRRRVALKIIKLGMDTRAVIARFEAERQALALMDHPNIARVLDGGATDAGRPYFVMELVQGVPITEYCDRNKLGAPERLKLFVAVCQAIQSAHQKGIIHRDIKPSNVLVTIEHGEPMPKVIDFGIAKATNQKLTEKTLFTNYATLIGTPAYMSPEQAEMTSLDVDTRADIYSLGVLLYELLTGTTPFPAERLRSLGYGEMQRIIVEEEPERPSTRLGTLTAEQKTTVARNRGNDLRALAVLLRGDLDWIVMRCLEKDRRRRYETANALAADVQRHISNEPVMARPPAVSYRLQKWVRRNRTIAVATATTAVALIGAASISTGAFVRERTARLQAVAAEAAREEARQGKDAESIRADTVATFATDMIDTIAPQLARKGHRESAKQMLQLVDRLATNLTNSHHAQARVRFAVGKAFAWYLDQHDAAMTQYLAVEALASNLGPTSIPLMRATRMYLLGSQMWHELNPSVARALVEGGHAALNSTPADAESAAFALGSAAEFYTFTPGQELQAEQLAREAADAATESSDGIRARLTSLHYLISLANRRGQTDEAKTHADRFFSIVGNLSQDNDQRRRERALDFLDTIWINDWTVFPESSLRKAIQLIPPGASDLRDVLQGLLGIAMARQGDWEGGFRQVQRSNQTSARRRALWAAEMQLARMLGYTNQCRALAISGIAQYANGADPIESQRVAWTLAPLANDPDLFPTISNLVARSTQATGYTRYNAVVLTSLFEYYSGHFQNAAKEPEEPLPQNPTVGVMIPDESMAWLSFLRAAIHARLGDSEKARSYYAEGVARHSGSLHAPGVAYTGEFWYQGCIAELMRREASGLLGGRVSDRAL